MNSWFRESLWPTIFTFRNRIAAKAVRVVVDTNRLTSGELTSFLMLSPNNRAVLTDFVAMEAFQPAQDGHVLGNMRVVSNFPKQAIVLKGAGECGMLAPSRDILPSAMIDRDQTKDFTVFGKAIALAHMGHPSVLAQIMERRGWAKDQLNLMLRETPDTNKVFANVKRHFSTAELAIYKEGAPLSLDTIYRILRIITDEAQVMADFHPLRPKLPDDPKIMINHFIWRLTLCRVLRIMHQVSEGAVTQKSARFRNDMVDAFIAAYATYFNGLMTFDYNAMITHQTARKVLRKLGVRLSRDYLDDCQSKVADLIAKRRLDASGELLQRG
jgi:hypothetical protein